MLALQAIYRRAGIDYKGIPKDVLNAKVAELILHADEHPEVADKLISAIHEQKPNIDLSAFGVTNTTEAKDGESN